ncbi:MAG: DUF1553 domain-containing protein, partial [Roseibacillus sp.]|nr:DUF1553 domain-containing protein [Roseibacillus sp.]
EEDVYSVTLKDVPAGTTALRLEVLATDETKQVYLSTAIQKSFSANIARSTDVRPRAQFVRINFPGDQQRYLHLAEVQVFSAGKNIAIGGAARQSSTYIEAVADRAIDGNTHGLYGGNSVAHAALSANPWWEVDLKNAHPIDSIVIWNRTDAGTQKRIMPYHITLFDQQRKVVWDQRREDFPNPSQTIVPKLGSLAIAAAFQSSPTTGTQAPVFVLDEALTLDSGTPLQIAFGEAGMDEAILNATLSSKGNKVRPGGLPELLAASLHGSPHVNIAAPNGTYTLQLLLYEGWRSRSADIVIEGKTVREKYDMFKEQGANFRNGSLLRHTFALTDGNIDIEIKGPLHLGGLILSKGEGEGSTSTSIVKAEADIDLRNVLKAINFGDSVNLSIGGIEFAAARVNATVDGVSNSAVGDVYAGEHAQQLPREETPMPSLKRVRILATTSSFPDGFGELPEEIRSIAMLQSSARDAKQAGQLAAYYRTIAPELEETRSRLLMARNQHGAIKPVTHVPIMRELPAAAQRPTYIQIRGSFMNLGDKVSRGTPQTMHPFPEGYPNNRLGLARWLVARDNPLTARVTVNRYWDELFGQGIVRTVEDFGSQGEQPSHPELLDWLASDFMEGGWDVKELLKSMVMSATYRQAATVAPELVERDPENRLLARGPNFRLSAEMVRDQSLAASGLLARKMYGPPAQPPQPRLGLKAAFGVSIDWTDSTGEDRYRRAVYTRWQRSTPYPSLAEFDSPSRVVSTSRRIRTNTPLQVLVTLNDPVYIEAAQALGRKMSAAAGDLSAKVRSGFRQCLSRPPTDEEMERLKALFMQCKTVFSESPEDAKTMATDPLGPAPEGADVAELAAWTVVSNVLLNTDEFLMKP